MVGEAVHLHQTIHTLLIIRLVIQHERPEAGSGYFGVAY
jgi:hypothetical protein